MRDPLGSGFIAQALNLGLFSVNRAMVLLPPLMLSFMSEIYFLLLPENTAGELWPRPCYKSFVWGCHTNGTSPTFSSASATIFSPHSQEIELNTIQNKAKMFGSFSVFVCLAFLSLKAPKCHQQSTLTSLRRQKGPFSVSSGLSISGLTQVSVTTQWTPYSTTEWRWTASAALAALWTH